MALPYTSCTLNDTHISGFTITESTPLDLFVPPSVNFPVSRKPEDALVTPDMSKAIYRYDPSVLYCIDQTGAQLWTHSLEDGASSAHIAISRDSKLFWYYQTDPSPPERDTKRPRKDGLVVVDIATGRRLAYVSLGSDVTAVDLRNSQYPVDDQTVTALADTTQTEDSTIYFARFHQGSIELTPFPWHVYDLVDISPDWTQCITTTDRGETIQVQSYPDGRLLRSIPVRIFGIQDGVVCPQSGGYISKDTAAIRIIPIRPPPNEDTYVSTFSVNLLTGRVIERLVTDAKVHNVFCCGDGSWVLLHFSPSRHVGRYNNNIQSWGSRGPVPRGRDNRGQRRSRFDE